MGLTVTDSADPVPSGSTLLYTFRYTNSGNAPATGTVVTAVYDPNVTFVSSTPTPDAGTNNRWTLGTVANGLTGQITVTATVNSPLANGTILSSQGLLVAAGGINISATQTTTVNSAPALSVSLSEGADPTPPGGSLVYTIDYANSGTDTTTGVVVTAAYDPILSFVSAVPAPDAGTTNRWTIGTLSGGQGGSIQVTLDVPSLPNGTPLASQVTVQDGGGRSATASESTTVASGVFSIDVSDNNDPATSGAAVEFTVSYGNASAALQAGVVMKATWDPNFVVESATPAPDAGTGDTWTLGALASGANGTLRVSGFFGNGAAGGLAQTRFQIQNVTGTAFATETTAVTAAPLFETSAIVLRKTSFADTWTLRGKLSVAEGFDAEGDAVEVAIFGPGGIEHVHRLNIGPLTLVRAGRLQVIRDGVPGHGKVKVFIKANRTGPWGFKAQARGLVGYGAGVLPETAFQIRVRLGSSSFLSEGGDLRDLSATTRRYP